MGKPSWVLIWVSQFWVTWGSLKSTSGSLGNLGWVEETCPSPRRMFQIHQLLLLGYAKRKDYLDPLVSSKQSQVRNLVQFRAALASTSFMHKHFPSEQTFLCGTNHASRACQQRTKTEMKECTSLQIQKAHTLASLGKLCTKAPTE